MVSSCEHGNETSHSTSSVGQHLVASQGEFSSLKSVKLHGMITYFLVYLILPL
jgi:hypothetical protein